MSTANASPAAPWTVARLLDWTRSHFAARGIDSPRLSAELLLAHALGCPRIRLYTHGDQIPEVAPLASFRDLVKRAAAHEPVAYLLGKREFFSLEFEVTRDVLIPRPETETLVTRILVHLDSRKSDPVHLLDIGTGSGCIAIALLTQMPAAQAVATDISPSALNVAGGNAIRHHVEHRIRFIEANGMKLPEGCVPPQGFDLIASNPPYIGQSEMGALPKNVVNYEPHLALTDQGDGLHLYRALAEGANALLAANGAIFVEIADHRRDAVTEIMERPGQFQCIGAWKGIGERSDRVLGFTRQG